MSSIILHISDLHVSLDKKIGGEINQHDSYLDTSSKKENSIHFTDKFISTIKSDFKSQKIYLLITGDTTNSGEKKEFDFALEFLERITTKLKIDKNNILLIPGDHDLNRRDITNLLAGKENSTKEEINIEKFKNFKEFYSNFLNKEFDANKIVFDTLIVEDSITLLGLNSCTEIDLTNKLGTIPISKFEEEIASIGNIGTKMIACVHHNLTSSHENSNNGQRNLENRQFFIAKLLTLGIGFVFTGNEHTNSTKEVFLGEIKTSDSGCLSTKEYDATFKVYPLLISENIVLKNKIYSLHKTGNNDSPYDWDIRTNKKFSQPEEYRIFTKKPPELEEQITEIIGDGNENLNSDATDEEVTIKLEATKADNYYNSEFTDILYDKVKELKIFHSGHFHWSESSRAHNWIDISKLIEGKDNLNFVKNAIIDVVEKKIHEGNIDLIIGLGYEGNIISTKAIKYNKPYCFLPYSYRYHEHHEFETLINFDNTDKIFKNVLVITDVVNDGRTIRKLIKKRQDSFFKNVEKIFVISLFYTGESNLNHSILNFDFVKTIPNYDIENDEEVNNIEFYTVKSLKVEKCPYGKQFRDKCFIYKDQLSCVNLFYDESKYAK